VEVRCWGWIQHALRAMPWNTSHIKCATHPTIGTNKNILTPWSLPWRRRSWDPTCAFCHLHFGPCSGYREVWARQREGNCEARGGTREL